MLKQIFFLSVVFTIVICAELPAQETIAGSGSKTTTKYFINHLEIAPQSIQFLNEKHIDSIRYYPHTRNVDTAVVLYTHKQDSLITFNELMDDYFVVPEARRFKVNTPNYLGVEEPLKMIFSENSVSGVRVYRSDGKTPGIVNISSEFEYLGGGTEIHKALFVLINKFNNLPRSSGTDRK